MAKTLSITVGRQFLSKLASLKVPIEGYMLLFLIAQDRDCARAYNRHFPFSGKLLLDLQSLGYLEIPDNWTTSVDKLLQDRRLRVSDKAKELLRLAVADGNPERKKMFSRFLKCWPVKVQRIDGTMDQIRHARRADAEKEYMKLLRAGVSPEGLQRAAAKYVDDLSRLGRQAFLVRPVTWLRNYTTDKLDEEPTLARPTTPYGGKIT